MKKLVEKRIIESGKVISLCIENQYYTSGTNTQYEEMLNMCNRQEATSDLILAVAENIWEHSNQKKILYSYGVSEKEVIANICYGLINDCCYTCVEITE